MPWCALYPYTAERRDVLENTPPEAQEISQGRGFCTPRPERLPEAKANLEGRRQCYLRHDFLPPVVCWY